MKAKEIIRDIHTIDAEGKSPGRIATQAAHLLIGKHKTCFEPRLDQGDHVQVINASKMIFTGNKIDQKQYYHHTTRARGLRITSLKSIWSKDPSDALRRAVSRMLPKNSTRTERMKRLIVTN